MDSRITVTVTLDDRKVTLEGPEQFVREEVARLTAKPQTRTSQLQLAADAQLPRTEREFVADKSPKTHQETVAVLGFWLSQKGQPTFTAEDIRRAYVRAGVRAPRAIDQALRDAKNKCDYLEPSGTPGSYRLTIHGENTVRFDLPRH